MPEANADLLIQITSQSSPTGARGSSKAVQSDMIAELRRCLRPGAELAVTYDGLTAVTSILWLSDGRQEDSLLVGVRLVGVSALPNPEPESLAASGVQKS